MKYQFSYPATRREFLKRSGLGASLLAFSPFAPAFLTSTARADVAKAEKDRSILVLIQLSGGNDGLNTIVPYQDDHYYRLRPQLGLRQNDLLKLDDQLGINASCKDLHRLFQEGQLGIVQNVGYPNPNRSHFRSMEIWETASDSRDYLSTGWVGRFFDNCCAGSPQESPIGINLGNEMPDAFLSEKDSNVFSYSGRTRKGKRSDRQWLQTLEQAPSKPGSNEDFLRHTSMNALLTEEHVVANVRSYRPSVEYPSNELAQNLRQVAAMIAAGQSTRVYFVPHSGFDTHANQLQRHATLLQQLSSAMAAFQSDLSAKGLDDQVLTMTFSEFGRRPSENKSGGTDHGTAAPLFVMGSQIKGGLHGTAPSLDIEKNKDLRYAIDFRSAYATLIDQWLDGEHQQALGRRFPTLDFLKA